MKFDIRKSLLLMALPAFSCYVLYADTLVPRQDAKKGQWGYVTQGSDKWKVKPKYDSAEDYTQAPNGKMRSKVTAKGKIGFVDPDGNPLGVGVVFESISPMEGDAMFVTVKGKTGVANYDGIYLVKPEATAVEDLGDEGYLVTIKNKQGILSRDGKWVVEPLYVSIDRSLPDYYRLDFGGKAGLSTREGKMLLAPKEFTKVEPFHDLWKIYKGKNVGLYDLSTQTVLVKPEYTDVKLSFTSSGDTYYPVEKGQEKWGLVNSKGDKVVKPEYTRVNPVVAENSVVLYKGATPKNIYLTTTGKKHKIRDFRSKMNGPYEEYEVRYTTSWDDFEGKTMTYTKDPQGNYISGAIPVKEVTGYYYTLGSPLYTMSGKEVIEAQPGSSVAKNISGWVVYGSKAVSPKGNVSDAKYKSSQDLLLIADGDKYRCVDRNGYLTELAGEDFIAFPKLYAVKNDGKWKLSQGSSNVKNDSYDNVDRLDDMIVVEKEGRKGLLDANGNEIYKCVLTDIRKQYPNYIIEKDGLIGMVSTGGNVTYEPKYTASGLEAQIAKDRAKRNSSSGSYASSGSGKSKSSKASGSSSSSSRETASTKGKSGKSGRSSGSRSSSSSSTSADKMVKTAVDAVKTYRKVKAAKNEIKRAVKTAVAKKAINAIFGR